MNDRFCPNCGTEVDEDARFCPTCGQTLLLDEDAPVEAPGGRASFQPDLPDAPAWPEPEPEPAPEPEPEPERPAEADSPLPTGDDEPTRTTSVNAGGASAEWPREAEPPARGEPTEDEGYQTAVPPPPLTPLAGTTTAPPADSEALGRTEEPTGERAGARSRGADLPFTWPSTLGGWLVGAGSLAGAIFLIPVLDVVLNVLVFLALLAVAATVFLADRVPDVPRIRLLTLSIVLIALGIALDRAAFAVRGVESLFLIAMLAAAGGVLLVELDRDRPVPPPGRSTG
ncbi:MAG TPA: zinc-ribbon domain-containing protein [Candidatus Limnocylindria bacterium]|nr:zinc-ribbon domain-containing protein [Candidatus Limnocylindria bacterium]